MLRLNQKEQEKQKTIDQLKERMIADYKTGQTSSLDLLLSASDFGEFMAGMEYIQRIAKHDKELTDTLEQQVNEIRGASRKGKQNFLAYKPKNPIWKQS